MFIVTCCQYNLRKIERLNSRENFLAVSRVEKLRYLSVQPNLKQIDTREILTILHHHPGQVNYTVILYNSHFTTRIIGFAVNY